MVLSAENLAYRRHTDILIALFFVSFILLAATGSNHSREKEISSGRRRPTKYHYNDDFDPNVTEYWFDAIIDHFNYLPTSVSTFPLRYFVNDQFYQNSSSPVIFYTGNEADIMQFVKNSGFLFEAAETLGAMVVFGEHRYYGKSFPFGSPQAALTPYNISFLTVEQAMADFNTLQLHIRKNWNMSHGTAFIAAGGSYGGNLALWLRLTNANLWAGAIASSATPVKHLLRESNAFNRIVADVYNNVTNDNTCTDKIRQGWKELFEQVKTESGRTNIKETFHLCYMPEEDRIDDIDIAESIHSWISGGLETMVQYGYPYPTNFYNPVPAYPFRETCWRMLQTNNGLEALSAAAQVYYNYTGNAGHCFDWVSDGKKTNSNKLFWNRVGQIDRLSSPTDHEDYTGTAWSYQCCTEVYQPMPTNGITDFEIPHTPNRERYFERCRRQWAGTIPRPMWEEMAFWSNNIQAGSNIFLASGQLDPWRAAGIQGVPRGSPKSIIVRIIEDGAHHYDLRGSHPLDPASVIRVREEELSAMRRWIGEWWEYYPSSEAQKSSETRWSEATTSDGSSE